MRLLRFDNGAVFQEHVLPFLMEREAEHNLILGIVAGIASGTDWLDPPPYLALVENEGLAVAVAVMTPPHNLLLSRTERLEALPLLLADLLSSGYGVPGVTASPPVAEAFAGLWQKRTGRQPRLAMAQRIYQLDQVRPPAGVPAPCVARSRAIGCC